MYDSFGSLFLLGGDSVGGLVGFVGTGGSFVGVLVGFVGGLAGRLVVASLGSYRSVSNGSVFSSVASNESNIESSSSKYKLMT